LKGVNLGIDGRSLVWGEEGERLFEFLRSVYLDSSLALDVEKKQSELRFFARRIALSLVVVAVA
jgi:hypothetical protein